MFRRIFLYLTDSRLRTALRTIAACGPALGDLAASPESAPRFFRPLHLRLARASAGGSGSRAGGAAAAAAENLAARLEKFFDDLALHKTAADLPLEQALACLQAACAEAPELLSPRGRAPALEKIRGLSAAGTKTLRLAKDAAEGQRVNFPQNLKFSSMYSGLEAVFDAFERCANALYGA